MPSRPQRLYVGNLSRDTTERDIREEFERYGELKDILMKQKYCFVEFRRSSCADEALRSLDGVQIHGRRWVVEPTRRPPKADRSRSRDRRYSRRDRGYERRGRYRSRSRDRRGYRDRRGRSYERPSRRRRERKALARGDFPIVILGISKTTSWQDLKDWARRAGNSVVYGDIIRQDNRIYGLIEYKYKKDFENALDTLHQTELHSKTVYVYEKGKAPSITPSPSPSPVKRTGSGTASKSKSRSRSRSAVKEDRGSKSRSGSRSKSKSRSASRSQSRSNSPSKMEEDNAGEETEDIEKEVVKAEKEAEPMEAERSETQAIEVNIAPEVDLKGDEELDGDRDEEEGAVKKEKFLSDDEA